MKKKRMDLGRHPLPDDIGHVSKNGISYGHGHLHLVNFQYVGSEGVLVTYW